MNKYKIVCLFLSAALVVALIRIFAFSGSNPASQEETVFNNIMTRSSVRSYTDKSVSREKLDSLVRAGMSAPTAKDQRPWKFIIIDEKAVLDILANQMPRAKMLSEAAAAIVVCGDTSVVDDKGKSSEWWVQDCSAASENILLAAHAMGLGAVWAGVFPKEDRVGAVCEALSLPDAVIPLSIIVMGYPKGEAVPKDKYNKDNIHYNGW